MGSIRAYKDIIRRLRYYGYYHGCRASMSPAAELVVLEGAAPRTVHRAGSCWRWLSRVVLASSSHI